MTDLQLIVKNPDGEIVKTVNARYVEISFGTIDKLMGLLDIDEDTTSFQLLMKVSKAWKEVTSVLNEVFPDMTDNDWCLVKINDLVPLLFEIVKFTFAKIMGIPTEKNTEKN